MTISYSFPTESLSNVVLLQESVMDIIKSKEQYKFYTLICCNKSTKYNVCLLLSATVTTAYHFLITITFIGSKIN